MSNNIEDRVVEMKFNNSAFEAGVAKTMSTLQALKEKLNFTGATKGLDDINRAGNKVDLSHIARGIDEISSKFSALSVVGITALSHITTKAIDAGAQLVKSFTIGPIGDGFNDYNAKLTSVKTVMNSTGKSINYVTGYFNQLDKYADQTVFSMSDMTSAFAKFTNAGISIEQAVPAIKGIGNLTALAGQGAESAQIAYYNLSQSLAGGFLTTIDYKSLQNANIATKEFRDRLVNTAVAAGVLKKAGKGLYTYKGAKNAKTEQQLFTESLADGWANAKILTDVLNQYGNSETEIGRKAFDAATKVKTLPQLMETLKAQVGTGWTDTFSSLIGNVDEATTLFTGLSNTIGGYIDKMNTSRNTTIRDWRSWGGRAALIQSVKNAFQALKNILGPIHDAFREVFPKTTARMLASLTIKFRMFTQRLIASKETMDNIKRTFVGVFTVLKILVGFVALGVKGFFNLLKVVSAALPGLLSLTAVAGDFVKAIANFLIFKNPIAKFFKGLSGSTADVLIPIVTFLSKMLEAISKLASGDMTGFTNKFKEAFASLGDVVDAVVTFIEKRFTGVTDIFVQVGDFLSTVGKKLVGGSSALGKSIGGLAAGVGEFLASFGEGTGKKIVDIFNGIGDAVKGLLDDLSFKFSFGGFDKVGKGAESSVKSLNKLDVVGKAVKKTFLGVVKAFKKVGSVLSPVVSYIGKFIGTLAEKIYNYVKTLNFQDIVSLINTALLIQIYRAVNGFIRNMNKTVGKFGNLMDQMSNTFKTLSGGIKTLQNNVRSKTILRYAIALGLLAASVYLLASIDPAKLAASVGALTVLMAELLGTFKLMGKFNLVENKGLVTLTFAMGLLAGAILGLAIALKVMASISTKDLAKGLGTIAILMATMAGAVKLMNGAKGIVGAAFGIGIIAFSLLALAGAIKLYSKFKPKVFSDGIHRVAEALLLIGIAFRTFPAAGAPGIAASLLLAVFAITMLVRSLKALSRFTKGQMAKALIGLGGALFIISTAMDALAAGGEVGAAALLVISVALRILIPALVQLGKLSLWEIIKMLVAFTGVLALLGGASIVLTPLVPVIIALAAAIGLLGVGMLAAGAGVALFSAGLVALATVGAASLAGLLALLPVFAQQVGLSIHAFVKVMNDAIPELISIGGTFIISLAAEIAKDGPILFQEGLNLLMGLLDVFIKNGHKISVKMREFADMMAYEIKENAGPIANAGLEAFLGLLNAFSDAVLTHKDEIYTASYNFGLAIAEGMKAGIKGGIRGFLGDKGSAIFDALGGNFVGAGIDYVGGNTPPPPPKKPPGQTFPTTHNTTAPTNTVGGNRSPATRGDSLRTAPVAEIDTNPTITPVIDMTEVNRAGQRIADLFASIPLTAEVSTVEARDIAASQPAAPVNPESSRVVELKFDQTINSPDPLSPAEVYRRTNTLVARAKRELSVPVS